MEGPLRVELISSCDFSPSFLFSKGQKDPLLFPRFNTGLALFLWILVSPWRKKNDPGPLLKQHRLIADYDIRPIVIPEVPLTHNGPKSGRPPRILTVYWLLKCAVEGALQPVDLNILCEPVPPREPLLVGMDICVSGFDSRGKRLVSLLIQALVPRFICLLSLRCAPGWCF